MLRIHRHDLAENLAAYGETEVSGRISCISDAEYRRICEIGFKHALNNMPLIKAACLAAVEVVEGKPRELKWKKRRWRDVARSPRPPDPIRDKVVNRFQRYAGGTQVKTAEIIDRLSKVMGANLKEFMWIKSRRRFCRRFADGASYVGLDCTRSNVSLTFGVRHERLEEALLNLFPEEKSKHPERLTIWKWSLNMGPSSPRWNYPTETTWPISGSDGLALATPEIIAFLKNVAEPYALRHRDPLAIRNTLLFLPGHADGNFLEDHTIFAIDYLARRRDLLDQDYEKLVERYSALAAQSEKDALSTPEPAVGIVFMMPKVQPMGSWSEQLRRTYDRVVAHWDG